VTITSRELLESIEGLYKVASRVDMASGALQALTKNLQVQEAPHPSLAGPLPGANAQGQITFVDPTVLRGDAEFLVKVAQELMSLIPDGPIRLGTDRRRFRTLVRIERFNPDDPLQDAQGILPGWNPDVLVSVPMTEALHIWLTETSKRGVDPRFHAYVNLGAERSTELEFSDYELVPWS